MHKTYKKLLPAVLTTALLATAAFWIVSAPDPDTGPEYTEAAVIRGDLSEIVTATGTVNPVNTVLIGSQISGVIAGLHADFNDQVKKGQVLALIDPALYRARVAEALANLESARAEVEKARVSQLDAARELERQEKLLAKKLVAENIRDAARVRHDSASVELEVQQAAASQAEAVLERERVNLAYTEILAPIDGVVISRDVDVGQTVAASLQAPTLFTIAKDLTQMQVEAEIDESFIGKIAVGQDVEFSVFAFPGRTFRGTLAQVRLQPKVESGVVRYNAIIAVDNPDLALKPGMTATVSVIVASHEQVLQVPASALRFVPDLPAEELDAIRNALKRGQRTVWTRDGERLQAVIVSTGIGNSRTVEVSGDGLQEGMAVLVPEKKTQQPKSRFGLSLF